MRKILFPLLLATAMATPAFAAERPPRNGHSTETRQQRQAERSQARQDRQQAHDQRQQSNRQAPRPQQAQRPEAPRPQQMQRFEAPRPQQAQRFQAPQRPDRVQAPTQGIGLRDRTAVHRTAPAATARARPALRDRQVQRSGATDWQQRQRQVAQQRIDSRDRWVDAARQGRRLPPPSGARPNRPAPAPATATHYTRSPTWHTNWRNDHRYDWNTYRQRHRSLFHLGIYTDPFGWGYQRWGIGWRLWPSFYSSNYWLDDPYMYRLPYAPWPYKWVRYYDDALLVDVYSGQVVDVMYDFFW